MIAGAPISGHPIAGRGAGGRHPRPSGAFRRGVVLCRRLFRRLQTRRVWQWRAGMPNEMSTDTIPKTPTEARYFAFDFSKFPELAGAAELLSDPAPVIRGASGLTVGTPTVLAVAFDGIVAGKGVKVRISGGSDDDTVSLSCVAYAAADVPLEVPGRLAVVEVV